MTEKVNSDISIVREARLELACPFGRHPLKMVCLPVPPLAQGHFKGKNEKLKKTVRFGYFYTFEFLILHRTV